jgi:hypothetical protein
MSRRNKRRRIMNSYDINDVLKVGNPLDATLNVLNARG